MPSENLGQLEEPLTETREGILTWRLKDWEDFDWQQYHMAKKECLGKTTIYVLKTLKSLAPVLIFPLSSRPVVCWTIPPRCPIDPLVKYK